MKTQDFNEAINAINDLKDLLKEVDSFDGWDQMNVNDHSCQVDSALIGYHEVLETIFKFFDESNDIKIVDPLDLPCESDFEKIENESDEDREKRYSDFIDNCAEKYNAILNDWIDSVEKFLDKIEDFDM